MCFSGSMWKGRAAYCLYYVVQLKEFCTLTSHTLGRNIKPFGQPGNVVVTQLEAVPVVDRSSFLPAFTNTGMGRQPGTWVQCSVQF